MPEESKTALSSTTQSQRDRLRNEIQTIGEIDTIDARDRLDIQAVAARIFELRHNEGSNIITQRITKKTACGNTHRGIALYIQLSGEYQGGCSNG